MARRCEPCMRCSRSRWARRQFTPVIERATLPMRDARQHLTLGLRITLQFGRDKPSRHILEREFGLTIPGALVTKDRV